MKSDLYLKFILTVIALSLSIIALGVFKPITSAYALEKQDIYNCWQNATINELTEGKWEIQLSCKAF